MLFRLILVLTISITCLAGNGQTLDDYLSKGLKNSPFLKDYRNQLKAGDIDSLKVLAGLKPNVGLAADLMYPPAFGPLAYDSSITDGGHYAALVRVDQPLFVRDIRQTKLQNVLVQKLTAVNNFKITESDLKEGITAQYIVAFADFRQVQFERTILGMLREQQNILNLLVDKGLYQQTDFLNLMVTIASRVITGKQAMMQYKNDLAFLNLLCGIHDTTAVELQEPDLLVRSRFDFNTSLTMEQLRIDSLKSVNSHLLVDLDYKPRFGVYADAGFNAITPRRLPYNLGTSIGLSFTMPLYDGKQKQMEHEKISLSEDSRIQYRTFYENRYGQQKDQLIEQLLLQDDLINEIKRQIASQEKLITLYKLEISKGIVRWLDFIAVVNSYAQSRMEQVQSEISRLQIINQLNYLK